MCIYLMAKMLIRSWRGALTNQFGLCSEVGTVDISLYLHMCVFIHIILNICCTEGSFSVLFLQLQF